MNKERLGKLLRIDEKRKELQELEQELQKSDFWQRKDASQVAERYSRLKNLIEKFDSNDPQKLKELETEALFSGPYDSYPAILTISAGTGGIDACDCAQIIERMYLRFAERKGFKVTLLYRLVNEEGGIKQAVYRIEGKNAYGWLKSEHGVHRIVRISPFNAQGLRQTSFVLVEVVPEIPEPEIEINPKDLKIETFRASGHGGQHVNTTDSAVRITHLPTGITVSCQNERSQIRNREEALKILKSRLLLLKEAEHKKQLRKLKGKTQASWGNQIRSYIFDPYQLVKDHRTQTEERDIKKVIDGELDKFVLAFLRWKGEQTK